MPTLTLPDPFAEKEINPQPTTAPQKRNPVMVVLGALALLAIAVAVVVGWDTIRTAIKTFFS